MKKVVLSLVLIASFVLAASSCGGGSSLGGIYDALSYYYDVPPWEVSSELKWDILWELNSATFSNPRVQIGPWAAFQGLGAGTYNLSYIGVGYGSMRYLPWTTSVTLAQGETRNLGTYTRMEDTNLSDNPIITAFSRSDSGLLLKLYLLCAANVPLDFETKVLIYQRLSIYESLTALLLQRTPASDSSCPPQSAAYSNTGPASGYDPMNNANLFIGFGSTGVATGGLIEFHITNNTSKTWDKIDFGTNYNLQYQSGSAPCPGSSTESVTPPGTYLNHLTGCGLGPGQSLDLSNFTYGSGEPHIISCETYDSANAFAGNCAPGLTQQGKTATATGRVVDGSGNPIAGVTVTIGTARLGYQTATTDANGNYTVTNIPAGVTVNRDYTKTGLNPVHAKDIFTEGTTTISDVVMQ